MCKEVTTKEKPQQFVLPFLENSALFDEVLDILEDGGSMQPLAEEV